MSLIKDKLPQVGEFTAEEKVLLLDELWGELLEQEETLPITGWQKDELDRRYEEHLKNPNAAASWETVKARVAKVL